MTSQEDMAVGNAEVGHTNASSVLSTIAPTVNAHIARATPTDPHNASSKGSPYHHLPPTQLRRDSVTPPTSPHGAASVYVTTQVTRRWTAQLGSSVATVVRGGTCSSYALISAMTRMTSSCMAKTLNWQTPVSTVTVKVEVELTSILKGG